MEKEETKAMCDSLANIVVEMKQINKLFKESEGLQKKLFNKVFDVIEKINERVTELEKANRAVKGQVKSDPGREKEAYDEA